MDFRKSEEQELLLENLKELLKREVPESYIKDCDEKAERPQKVVDVLFNNGFFLIGVPEEYGGTPVDYLTIMMVTEELAKHGLPYGLFGASLQIHDMMSFGSPEQLKITSEYLMKGKDAFCLGFTEPQAGSDSNMIQTTFTRKNGKVYINGQKTFITGAKEFPYMLCMAKDPTQNDPRKAFTMWWLPMDAKGVEIKPLHKIGWRTISNCEVFIDNVELEESNMCGEEGKGFLQLMDNFEVERLIVAAYCLGWAEAAFEDAARYANQRVQFGQPVGNFQMIQEKLTQMYIKVENMRNALYRCAWEKDSGMSIRLTANTTKLYCAQAGFEVIDDALQILGGLGYTNDSRVSRLWRDSRVMRIGGGTDEIMIYISGRQILKQYLKP